MDIKALYESNKQRILTGLLMTAFAIFFAILNHPFVTWLVLGIVYLFAFHEAMKLFDVEETKLYAYALALWLAALIYPNPSDLIFLVLILMLGVMAYTKSLTYAPLIPFLYPSLSMLFLYGLYRDFGMGVLVWLVIVVALTDTGAYFVGKSIGKTPFSPTSPNKTLEGVLGGVFLATLVGGFVGAAFVSLPLALILSLLTSVASIFGDLFESLLKREAGVKDSGTLFPGHGGMLDRLDGYLFGVVVMVVVLRGFA